MAAPVSSEETRERLQKLAVDHLEEMARLAIFKAINQVLGGQDLLFLSGLGIDGRRKMLDVFIKECRKLKKENANGQWP